MKTIERTTETTEVMGTKCMRREALDLVDFSSRQSESEHKLALLHAATWTKKSLAGISVTIQIGAGADE